MKDSTLYKELKRLSKIIDKGGNLSYDDIAFLSNYQTEIKAWFPSDVGLWQWAGIPEEEWGVSQ